ncbi:polysaccharide deacetylase 2 family uncharacterized protein YibQ [Palleronia aestuarii]|uniref:Polysaccharide deacetylase 2 family uncharacterized protein YibQ n=1 Tax=Palleronia aestuarii TaxID=568105 RepID=A0A2W7NBT2_9RHOB|nr:divergent polysaccharide deacetylase family protein [Palleronia aestuarii]PZX17608.1 polysaccharide deacetylase 2 family uncharacterized protein YibQ [Palleronia aestuarii]
MRGFGAGLAWGGGMSAVGLLVALQIAGPPKETLPAPVVGDVEIAAAPQAAGETRQEGGDFPAAERAGPGMSNAVHLEAVVEAEEETALPPPTDRPEIEDGDEVAFEGPDPAARAAAPTTPEDRAITVAVPPAIASPAAPPSSPPVAASLSGPDIAPRGFADRSATDATGSGTLGAPSRLSRPASDRGGAVPALPGPIPPREAAASRRDATRPVPLPVVAELSPRAAIPPLPGETEAAAVLLAQLGRGEPGDPLLDGAERLRARRSEETGDPRPVPPSGTGSEAQQGGLPDLDRESRPAAIRAAGMASDAPALKRFAVPFDADADMPQLSLIVLDSEAMPMDLPPDVTIGIDAAAPDAEARSEAYRQAGHEIVLVPAIAPGATPGDAEVGLMASLRRVPEAVAVMSDPDGRLQDNRAASAQVVARIEETGHGLVTLPRGLDRARRLAESLGVASGTAYRVIGGPGEDDIAITRAIEQAALRARQSSPVILVLRGRPETLAAVTAWREGAGAAGIAIAPLSAALDGGAS